MNKHTPGPWSIAEGDGCAVVETDIAGVRFIVQGENREGDLANARLIAAAPDLLAVLQDVMDRPLLTEGSDWWMQVRAAITKATGEKE